MSKSWLALIAFGISVFLIYTGFEIFQSITGSTVTEKYTVDQIDPDFGEETLTFLDKKKDLILVHEADI